MHVRYVYLFSGALYKDTNNVLFHCWQILHKVSNNFFIASGNKTLISCRELLLKGRLSTIDLLVRISHFVKIIFSVFNCLGLVSKRRSIVLILVLLQ